MTFEEIEKLIGKAQIPLSDKSLEEIQLINGEGYQPYFRFLYYLAEYMNASLSVEIGIYNGCATMHLAKKSKTTLGIDHNTLHELHDFTFIHGNSTSNKTLKKVKKYGEIDILFQDSSHQYLPSIKEWEMYSPLMSRGGVWVCDDITPAFYNADTDPEGCGMVQYFEEIPMENKKLYPDVLHRGNTQGIILF